LVIAGISILLCAIAVALTWGLSSADRWEAQAFVPVAMALAFVLGSLLQWVLGLPFVRWDYRLLLRSWILGSAAQLILVSLGCLILAQSLDRDASSVMVVAGFSIAVLASVAAYAGSGPHGGVG
jgi:putative Mn2+ efflux pump MntP